MKALKSMTTKKTSKQDREHQVLIGLIEYYLQTGKPVGSNTLKEAGFELLSSATIRNYFAHLEEAGYLSQQHASGGRVPTNAAFRLYASEIIDEPLTLPGSEAETLKNLRNTETREIASYLQQAADTLASLTQMPVFMSAPRFDQDMLTDIKLVPIDQTRSLCVMITDFGVIKTETLRLESKLTAFAAKRIEAYFHHRLTGQPTTVHLDVEEESLALKIYNEVLVRYIVGYSNFVDEEIYRTGFSKLLAYPEFHDPQSLSNSLILFENAHSMRMLLKDCRSKERLLYWIGEDLEAFAPHTPTCAVLALPYRINQQPVGAFGILGPVRMQYRPLFSLMRHFSESISEALTRSIYKHKISFRQPDDKPKIIGKSNQLLLEDQR